MCATMTSLEVNNYRSLPSEFESSAELKQTKKTNGKKEHHHARWRNHALRTNDRSEPITMKIPCSHPVLRLCHFAICWLNDQQIFQFRFKRTVKALSSSRQDSCSPDSSWIWDSCTATSWAVTARFFCSTSRSSESLKISRSAASSAACILENTQTG